MFVEQVREQLTTALIPAAAQLSKSVQELQACSDQITAMSSVEQQETEAEAGRVKGALLAVRKWGCHASSAALLWVLAL